MILKEKKIYSKKKLKVEYQMVKVIHQAHIVILVPKKRKTQKNPKKLKMNILSI